VPDTVGLYEVGPSRAEPIAAVTAVEVCMLRLGPKLRLGRVRRDHLDVLVRTGGNWPPILVRRHDNTIIDGYYRLLAAQRLGLSHMNCLYFDGSPAMAFLEAVRLNSQNGLPLSLRERHAAAQHILTVFPDWSDRRVSELCGLSPGTIGRQRAGGTRSPDQNEQLNARRGRDGKCYPADPQAARARILAALRDDPVASLRHIARVAGASPATVKVVKTALTPQSARTPPTEHSNHPPSFVFHENASSDLALVSTSAGESFAKWFDQTRIASEWRSLIEGIPISRVYEIADEARRRALAWNEFASALEAMTNRR
jgi:hypothetical protein